MLEAGASAVEVMTEYVRACRQLGHSVPQPADLHAAYTAEEGLDLHALDDDRRTLDAAVAAFEEAILLQEQARRALTASWRGAGAEAAADHLMRHAQTAAAAVDGLRATTAALTELRNRLWQLMDAKVGTARDIEARGVRAEWLSASRTVTTGAGDRAGASEMVDMQVAPFVINDIALDWVSAMRDTESAVRQAYRDAVAAMAAQASVVFERPGLSGAEPVAAEVVTGLSTPASVAPAGYLPGPAPADIGPAQVPVGPAVAPGAPPSAATAAPSAPVLPPVPPPMGSDPMAAVPMASGASPLGSGMSGLSGLGQSFADMLGGLLGSGGDALGENLGTAGDLDIPDEDVSEDAERDDLTDPDPDDENDEDGEHPDDEDPDDEDLDEDDPDDVEPPADEASAEEPVAQTTEEVPAEPVAVTPDQPAPTPAPGPPVDPVPEVPADPVPPETPCEIAADELPQAGP